MKDQGTDEPPMDYEPPEIQRPRKKREHSARLVSVTQRAILSEVGADINIQLNCANPSRTLRAIFVEQLLTEGSLKWSTDMSVKNDYNPTAEYLMPQSFVHVSCTNEDVFFSDAHAGYMILYREQQNRELHCHLVKSMYPIQHKPACIANFTKITYIMHMKESHLKHKEIYLGHCAWFMNHSST